MFLILLSTFTSSISLDLGQRTMEFYDLKKTKKNYPYYNCLYIHYVFIFLIVGLLPVHSLKEKHFNFMSLIFIFLPQ